jgi:hypothetical protein
MRKHRRTSDTVPNNPQLDNFNPADALESLHTEIVQLEAFAHAAGEAVTHLPRPANPTQPRDLTRIYALVSKVADDIATAASHGDKLIAALSAHLQAADPDANAASATSSSQHGRNKPQMLSSTACTPLIVRLCVHRSARGMLPDLSLEDGIPSRRTSALRGP